MPLSELQKKILAQRFKQGLLGKEQLEGHVKKGNITSAEEFAGYDMRLVEMLKSIFASQPNPQEAAEWERIVPMLNTPGDELKQLLLAYINKWEPIKPFGNHVTVARNHLDSLGQKMEEADWAAIVPLFDNPSEEMKAQLQAFLKNWSNSVHAEEAQQHIAAYEQQLENAEWQNVNMFSIDSMIEYLSQHPYSTHLNEIDDAVWNILAPYNHTDDQRDRLEQYRYYFPQGSHMMEAYEIHCSLEEWEQAKNANDLVTTHQFIKTHAESPYFNDARMMELRQKQDEFEKMKKQFNEYDYQNLLYFINEGIFQKDELIAHGVATKESIKILEDIEEIKDTLPNIDSVIVKCQPICYENHTDIYLFGIPGTGKSCVLAGMVTAEDSPLHYNSVLSGGPYADAMVQYLTKGMPPPPTKINYLTTIKGSMTDSKGHLHDCNLVEMAGEEFAFHVAENDQNELSFEQMGTGVTNLLSNDNRKLFFIVVDPTKTDIYYNKLILAPNEYGDIVPDTYTVKVNQRQCLKRMVDLFSLPENAEIMKKVEGIHFIITKADTFDCPAEQRDQYALDFFTKEYTNITQSLTRICQDYGINANKNKEYNGFPNLYTFSLGKFYVGNIVGFNKTDSLKIINSIINNTGYGKTSFWEKIKDLFN